MGETYLRLKIKDQDAALAMIDADHDLQDLRKVQAPMVGVRSGATFARSLDFASLAR